jgi:hypothetical protein
MAGSLSGIAGGMMFACRSASALLAISHADEWLRDPHEYPEEDVHIKGGDMRDAGEVFEKAPDGANGKGSSEAPEHGLNEDGALKLVGLFDEVEANDDERSDERQCREYGEEINGETSGMKVVEGPLGNEEKETIDSHSWGEAVDVAETSFRMWNALHDKIPFHKDN